MRLEIPKDAAISSIVILFIPFVEMLSVEKYPLTDFMSFKNGMNPDAKRFGSGTKFISVMDILNNQYICYDNIRASVELQEGDLDTYGVNYGDIVFQRSSETLEDVGQANVYLD